MDPFQFWPFQFETSLYEQEEQGTNHQVQGFWSICNGQDPGYQSGHIQELLIDRYGKDEQEETLVSVCNFIWWFLEDEEERKNKPLKDPEENEQRKESDIYFRVHIPKLHKFFQIRPGEITWAWFFF